MSRLWVLFGAAFVTLAALILVYVVEIPLDVVLSIGFGALCLLWLVFLLTLPWNLCFQAHALLHEIRASRERGIAVSLERDKEARRIAVRMRWAAIGAHVVSAGVLAVITYVSGATVGYYFAGFYLLSTFFRPAGAYFAYLKKRMSTMLKDVKYPRDDVLALRKTVDGLKGSDKNLRRESQALTERINELERRLRELRMLSDGQDAALDRKIDAMGRKFEDSVSTLTDNQEVISGVKAFLRLIRSEQAGEEPVP